MPKVPDNVVTMPRREQGQMPSQTDLAMAAVMMAEEGRLPAGFFDPSLPRQRSSTYDLLKDQEREMEDNQVVNDTLFDENSRRPKLKPRI